METNVIDTNVIAVANGKFFEVSETCKFSCEEFLENIIITKQRISIDDRHLIFQEYLHYADLKGIPGVGDAFIQWLWQNMGREEICEVVNILPLNVEETQFDTILSIEAFDNFDPADKKFLAVAFGSQFEVTIHNATDSDWESISEILPNYQINLNQLC